MNKSDGLSRWTLTRHGYVQGLLSCLGSPARNDCRGLRHMPVTCRCLRPTVTSVTILARVAIQAFLSQSMVMSSHARIPGPACERFSGSVVVVPIVSIERSCSS